MSERFELRCVDDRSSSTVVDVARGLRRDLLGARVSGRACFVVDQRVHELWSSELGLDGAPVFLTPPGEAAKTPETLVALCRFLGQQNFERSATLVSIGGGACGDVTGLAASLYLRGVAVIHVPTTLVAMVDAALGGKTAIDLPEGKNLVGSFHTPTALLVDPDFLSTLPRSALLAGYGEIAKYAIGFDKVLGDSVLRDGVLSDPEPLEAVITRCLRIKASVVANDLREAQGGQRMRLNLGHTTAHAIEAWSLEQGRELAHGQAVAYGLRCALRVARQEGLIADSDVARCEAVLDRVEAPTSLAALVAPAAAPDASELTVYLRRDKKVHEQPLRLVLPTALGACTLRSCRLDTLLEALR
ncbi:MAG TPA: 3-dehydroquinate synthase family protein [Planctomycetota bacterium]|nr:3-dehydroquinate synthase family protein [Planctomycetota bacterium]